jgi:hypothetical protein
MAEDNIKCIKYLKGDDDGQYYNRWLSLKTLYQKVLDDGYYASEIKFNTHDYSTHCINIYKNMDKLIDWTSSNKPTYEEMFLLDAAVILHDFCMATMPQKRLEHSSEALKLIIEKMNSKERNIINTIFINSEAEIVGEIILGHSDTKLKIGSINNLQNLLGKYKDYDEDEYRNIRVCHLACMLRIADELDVTSDRIKCTLNEMNFDMDSDSERESRKHYRKLELVSKVMKDSKVNNQLILVANEYKCGVQDDDYELIAEVKNKIEAELEKVNEVYEAFSQSMSPFIKYEKVYIKFESDKEKEKRANHTAEELKKNEDSILNP